MPITGGKTITVTGKYINFVSGAGEIGSVQFIPSIPSLSDTTDSEFLTIPPFVAVLPGGVGNTGGPGTFTIVLPCTDNTELYPQGFTYTIIERVSNMANRITKGVKIPSTYGSTVDLTTVLSAYI